MEPLRYPLAFALSDEADIKQGGEAVAALNGRTLSISRDVGGAFSVPYFEILGIVDEDYSVVLHLASGERLKLTQLGYEYENFLNNLFRLRNELLLRYMLMQEEPVASGIEAEYRFSDEEGGERQGHCEARVYESGLVILPDKSEPIRIPLSYLSGCTYEDYRYTVTTEYHQRLVLAMMGERTEYFGRSLAKAIGDADARARRILTDLAPSAEPQKIGGVATLMRDGKAASRRDVEAVSTELWNSIEGRIREGGLGEEYRYLLDQSDHGGVWVGVKRGLMGDRTGEYLWFMVPITHDDPAKPGNVLVVEATSEGDAGKATYLFRIVDRGEYRKGLGTEQLRGEVDRFVSVTNRCMIDVNYRREPIYLPDERLREPEYEMYLYAANRLSPLRHLRRHYLGRVSHVSPEQWRRGVDELLAFNVQSIDNEERMRKGQG